MVLAVCVVLPANAVAASPAASTVLTAPYGPGVITVTHSTALTGCGNASILPAPHFSLHRGVGGFGDRAGAWSCGPSTDRGIAYLTLQIGLPIHFATGGNHTIVANLSTKSFQTERLAVGTCTLQPNLYSYCWVVANQSLSAVARLVDLNTGSQFPSANGWLEYNVTSHYSYSTGNGGNASYYANYSAGAFGTFALDISGRWSAHHRYQLVVEFIGYADARIETFQSNLTGAEVVAHDNFATLGNGFTLNSVTVT